MALVAAPGILIVAAASPASPNTSAGAAALDEDGDGLLQCVQGVLVGIRLSVDTWVSSEGHRRASGACWRPGRVHATRPRILLNVFVIFLYSRKTKMRFEE